MKYFSYLLLLVLPLLVISEEEIIEVNNVIEFMRGIDEVDSFHVVDLQLLKYRYALWQKVFPNVHPFYSVKTNHDPMITKTLASLGVGFDCASEREIQQILSQGVAPARIIFAHTRKPCRSVDFASNVGVTMMTFDSRDELDKMMEYAPDGEYILRIWADSHHSIVPSLSAKFGATMEEAHKLLHYAAEIGVNVIGISFHVGSNCFESEPYFDAIKNAAKLFDFAEMLGLKFSILDLGGGWLGTNDELFVSIGSQINDYLSKYFDSSVRLIAEPGRFFANPVVTVATRVIGKSIRIDPETQQKKFSYYLSNGLSGFFIASLYFDYDPVILAKNGWNFQPLNDKDGPIYEACLWGPTCDPGDKILDSIWLPELERSDYIYSANVGAYTYTLQNNFNQITPSKAYYVLSKD